MERDMLEVDLLSNAVGKKLMAGAADTVKKVSLELGGNAPCIIFDDADLEVALKGSAYIYILGRRAYMFLEGVHICSNEFDEKAQRAYMFFEECTYVLGMALICFKEFNEKHEACIYVL
ncbi:succinate-semialdehyde dehydrogenase, mitochondrial [Tanacetum coccineum]